MKLYADKNKAAGEKSPMIFGHFLEHFHRQIYGGVDDPGNPLSDEEGMRTDVIEALRKIKTPIIRWPGGCFVSTYNWKKGVGKNRVAVFDKSWRVEDTNEFGTDEFISLCKKIGCEPYICTNAGTGTIEEMSDWVEYCNLENEGEYAKARIENGHKEPYSVKYWSIGNENYGSWELGAKSAPEWGRMTVEAAKLMKHVDPSIELSSAALADIDWNVNLLKNAGRYIDRISIHGYWDFPSPGGELSDYDKIIEKTGNLDDAVRKVRGLLDAFGVGKKIKIAYDEWNLRGWYHPNVHTIEQGRTKEDYLYPRDKNDLNSSYTMADAVFSACFLNMCMRNCDIVKMANFSPAVNTRGCIFTHKDGIVLRSTYFVFLLYANLLGDIVLDEWETESAYLQNGIKKTDAVVTYFSETGNYAIAAVNRDGEAESDITLCVDASGDVEISYISGVDKDSYNDIDRTEIDVMSAKLGRYEKGMKITLKPHSVNVISIAEIGTRGSIR